MASIDQIIKDLEEIRDSGGARSAGGGTATSRRQAALQAKEALENSKEFNKGSKQRIELEIRALKIAQNQYKLDEKEYKVIALQIKNREREIEQNEKMLEIGKKLGDSFVGLGKAAFEGSGSISAFTDNIVGLKLIGQRLDVNIETFRQLSQTGANFGKSIVDLRQAAANAALPLDDFASLVANNSQNLAALFGSTTQGAKAIALLGAQTRELGIDRLAPLGFTVEEINETLLLNLDNQRRAGVLNQLTDQQRINSSIAFAEQLDRLAKLTGQQRDELRAQIEQQQANERFQAFLQGQTVETGNRLRAFAGTVAGISPQLAEGFQDLIANAGVPVTESALALVQNIPGARQVVQDLISGVVSSEDALVRIRDLSAGSIDKFRQATVTGQVEFLQLQGGIIELGRRVTDTGAVLDEQAKSATNLVKGLTTFEQASKVLASQFQQVETGLLQGFGPALGGLVTGIQGLMGGLGGLVSIMAKSPALTGTAIAGLLTGKFLFNRADQTAIIAAGTAIGTGGGLKSLAKGLGLKGATGGRIAGMAGRALPAVGAAIGVGSSAAMLASDDANTQRQGAFGLGGAALGAAIGTAILPGLGTLIGAGLGSVAGQFAGARQFGGPAYAGQMYMTGETGPEAFVPKVDGQIVSNTEMRRSAVSENNSLTMKMIEESKTTNTLLGSLEKHLNNLNNTSLEQLKGTNKLTRRTAESGNIITA